MNTKNKGQISEDIVCMFLVKRGYVVISRNYLKKWGELDIVAKNGNVLHFIEVKATLTIRGVWNPAENVTRSKVAKIKRTAMTFLAEFSIGREAEFVFDVAEVHIDMQRRIGRVNFLENCII